MKKLYIQPETTSQKTQCTFSLCDGIFSVHGDAPFGIGGGADSNATTIEPV